ncbi:MAG: maltose ABC transporter substrate-binding protein [Lachnospiraceae bacterium]|nr:maltose ABC transporter substrate-binding protein [Lachnospiraceae bacterium]
MKKKALAAFMAAAMMLGLVACSGNTSESSSSSAASENVSSGSETAESTSEESETASMESDDVIPEEGASLILWMDNDDYNEQIVELWSAKYPDIPLTVENVGTTDARQKLELEGPTGTAADVFVQAHDGVAVSAQSGLILEIDAYTDYIQENFMENAVEAVTYDGKVYAFPLSIKTIALFYNKDLVDEPVTTWDEMREFALSYNDPSQNKFAILWQATEPYYAHGFLGGYGYEMFGENHDDPDQLGWDTEEAIEGMEFFSTLSEIYPVTSTDATWDAMNTMFSAGEAPYVITGPWSISEFTEAGVNFGVTTLPLLPNGEHPITLSTVDTVCVSAYTQYPNAAMLLAKFLTDEEAITLLYDTKVELPASIIGQTYEFVVNDVNLQGVAAQAEYSLPMPYIPEMASVWTPYQKAFVAVWDGLSTAEEALASAQEEFYASLLTDE